jgi:hypothetical protein
MPFNAQYWGRVSANGNTSFIVQSNGVHVREGSPAIFAYAAPAEPLSEVVAANYFSHPTVVNSVCAGDLINIDAIDGFGLYYVNSVNSVSMVLTVLPFDSHLGTVTSITAGAGLAATDTPITDSGTISIPNLITAATVTNPSSITFNARGMLTAAVAGPADTVQTISQDSATFPSIIITEPTADNYSLQVPSAAHVFNYSFSLGSGGTGQAIPFDGEDWHGLDLTPTLYNVFSVFNPQSWAIGVSGRTIRIPTSATFTRAWYEVEIHLVVDMETLPTDGGNWGILDITLAPSFPTIGFLNRYTDNFHPGSGGVSGSTYYKAITKAIFVQSGGVNPADDLYIAFPIRNMGGPGDWTIRNGCISIRRVGTEV